MNALATAVYGGPTPLPVVIAATITDLLDAADTVEEAEAVAGLIAALDALEEDPDLRETARVALVELDARARAERHALAAVRTAWDWTEAGDVTTPTGSDPF